MANFPALGMRPHPLAVRLCKHRHGRPQKFFQGWAKWTFCLSFSGCRRYNANGRSHNALPFLHHKENPPCYGNSPKNGLLWQQCFFSHRVNYITANSSHCMATLPATDVCVQQPHAAKRLLPNCCCFAIKVNFSTIGSRVLQFASAGKRADLVSCKLITAWYQNSEPSFCAAWVSYRQINYQCKLQCGGFATLRKSWEIIVNPDAVGYQTTAVIIAYWLINQRFQNFFNRDRNLSLVNILRPKSQTAYVNMTKMLIVWTSFGSRLLSSFSTSAFYSFLKYLRCITNRHRQTYKFEKIQVRLRFWSPLRDLFS